MPRDGLGLPVWNCLIRAHAFPGVFHTVLGKKWKVCQARTSRGP